MGSGVRATGLWVALVATAAGAQQLEVTTQAGVPYPGLSSGTTVPLAAVSGTAADRGRATLPLGFTFPWFNRAYSQLTVTANGVAFLEPSSGANQTSDFLVNTTLPNVAEPNGSLAPFWDDLDGNNPGSLLRSAPVGGPNGQGLAVEWKDWNRHFGTFSLTFQLRLWENGVVEFFYGPMSGTGSVSATIGVESPGGDVAAQPFTCGTACTVASLAPDGGSAVTYVRFGPPPGADLVPTRFTVDSVEVDGGTLTLASTIAVRNFGTVDAGSFGVGLYLSQDTLLDSADTPLVPLDAGVLALGPYATGTLSQRSTAPMPAAGSFFILARVDDADAVAETNETNNLTASAVPLAPGTDLVALSVSGPAVAGPGDPLAVDVAFSNAGFTPAGPVTVQLWLSYDGQLSTDDRPLWSTTIPVLGGQTIATTLTPTLAGTVPAGDYYVLLQLDGGPQAGTVVEWSDANNVVASTRRVHVMQADLVVDLVEVREAVTPFDLTDTLFPGEPARFEAVVHNQGGARATNVTLAFFLSDNEVLNALGDPFVGEQAGLDLPPGASASVTVTATVPATFQGHALANGAWFAFAAAIAPGLAETNATNNVLHVGPLTLRPPAPNLKPTSLFAPAVIGVGDRLVVSRTLANTGNRPVATAKYRYVLSANPIVTAGDVPLGIVTASGVVPSGSVSLGVGARDSAQEVLEVPLDAPAGTMFVGVLLDPEGLVAETNESDNGLVAAPSTVLPQALGLALVDLPDARVGLPYRFAFTATGANGAVTFRAKDAAELPAGLTLDATGVLSGTPLTAGVPSFTVVVEAGGRSAEARRALRVVPMTAPLEVLTGAVPPAPKGKAYAFGLAASGGVQPYRWALTDGLLPEGLSLGADGVLQGAATAPAGDTRTFSVAVVDAVGSLARATLSIVVTTPTPFRITTTALPGAVDGQPWHAALDASNADGTAVVRPVSWRLVGGQLPPGLELEESPVEHVELLGTPTQPGSFGLSFEARDALGRVGRADYLLRVEPSPAVISGKVPSLVSPGEAVSATLALSPAQAGTTFFVFAGALPPGLALGDDGVISGTVPADASYGSFTVTLGAGPSRAVPVALRVTRIDVVSEAERRGSGCGCDALPDHGALAGLAWLVLVLGRRRKNVAAPKIA